MVQTREAPGEQQALTMQAGQAVRHSWDMATEMKELVVGYGPDAGKKYITTYFRHSFSVLDASAFVNLTGRVQRDDCAIVYVNGTEVYRSNMPNGSISYATLASIAVGTDENTFFDFPIPTNLLVNGTNVLAVEIHQVVDYSSDTSFDMELVGDTNFSTANVTCGPYLQTGTSTGITVVKESKISADVVLNQTTFSVGDTLSVSSLRTNDATPDKVIEMVWAELTNGYKISFSYTKDLVIPGNYNNTITIP